MNVQDIYYHGVRDQIRRVISKMTEDQLDRGMTAFENGASNWSHCFFARALRGEVNLDNYRDGGPEQKIMRVLGIDTPVPIRIVYCTFDGLGRTMTRKQLAQFIEDVRDESRPQEVLDLIKGIDYSGAAERPITASISCE